MTSLLAQLHWALSLLLILSSSPESLSPFSKAFFGAQTPPNPRKKRVPKTSERNPEDLCGSLSGHQPLLPPYPVQLSLCVNGESKFRKHPHPGTAFESLVEEEFPSWLSGNEFD